VSPDPNGADAVERAKGLILAASEDPQIRNSLFRSFAEDCRISERAFLLWNGCMRHSEKYRWPAGFSVKWKTSGYRGLVNAGGNGPPRTAFTVAGGEYVSGWELDHVYDRVALRANGLPEGRHFTQSAGLICMTPDLHQKRSAYLLWVLRGLTFLRFGYDPLGTFSGAQPDAYGFVNGRTCDVFWP
jgi:hypothetical protein